MVIGGPPKLRLKGFLRLTEPKSPAVPTAARSRPVEISFGDRLDEAAAACHSVTHVKVVLTLLSGLAMTVVLSPAVCAAWALGGVLLEAWGWLASRPAPAGGNRSLRARAGFAASFTVLNLWWFLLSGLIWVNGGMAGQAGALAIVATVSAISILLVYNAAWVYLIAGAAPAMGALFAVAHADGNGWGQMWPIWVMLALSAVFCVERAFKTPSAQASERRVKASLRDFEIIAENVTEIITRTNIQGVREYVSPGCFAMLGYHPEELIGTIQRDSIHPDDQPAMEASKRRIVEQPDHAGSITVRVRHRDGRWLWLQSSAKLIFEDGVPVGMIGVSRDVTQQVADEAALFEAKIEAEAANRAKAEFLANVSHEIRTPMNGVLGALQLIERENISAEGRELIRQASDCGRMLSQLLNDVLDFSKIDAGQLELAVEPMRAGEALEGVVALLAPQARAKGIDLRCEIEGGDLWIAADPVRVRQAMFNLLGNAVKFTARGHVTARLAVAPSAGGACHVRFTVEDTGIGIGPKAQKQLFQRFRQAEADTSRRFGGAGLGLSITQTLARMMGGDVTVASVEGQGSTFTMVFDAPAAAAEPSGPAEEGLLDGVAILLVEDNPTNRLVARTMLTRLGASVDEAEDGVVGLEAARSGAYDLILMDVQMPHMNGIEATRAIRGLADAAAAQVPILGLTANVMVHQRREYLAAGMNGVVAKPISAVALLGEIGRVIAEAEAEAPELAGAA
jgi:PAS domain S-box-containing protein